MVKTSDMRSMINQMYIYQMFDIMRLSQKSISTLMILIKWMKADLIHVDNQRYTKNIIIFVRVNL